MYQLICARCGNEFEHRNHRALYCDECREEAKKETRRKHAQMKREKISRVFPPKQSINEILAELDAYNKTHNTHLSYGQYVAMKGAKKWERTK